MYEPQDTTKIAASPARAINGRHTRLQRDAAFPDWRIEAEAHKHLQSRGSPQVRAGRAQAGLEHVLGDGPDVRSGAAGLRRVWQRVWHSDLLWAVLVGGLTWGIGIALTVVLMYGLFGGE